MTTTTLPTLAALATILVENLDTAAISAALNKWQPLPDSISAEAAEEAAAFAAQRDLDRDIIAAAAAAFYAIAAAEKAHSPRAAASAAWAVSHALDTVAMEAWKKAHATARGAAPDLYEAATVADLEDEEAERRWRAVWTAAPAEYEAADAANKASNAAYVMAASLGW